MIKNETFIKYLKEQLGSCYLWGGQGESLEALKKDNFALVYKKETTEANAKRVIDYITKNEKKYPEMKAYDCSGLLVNLLLQEKEVTSDMTANTIFNKCKQITKAELRKGDFVFRWNAKKTKVEHIGYYIGDNKVIHSKGRAYGVIEEDITKSTWNDYGRSSWIEEEKTEFIFTENLYFSKCHNKIREDVKQLQKLLMARGYDLGSWGADGDFGTKTRAAVLKFQKYNRLGYDGIAGKNTIKALGGKYVKK